MPKTAVISIKELSKDSSCVEALIQRGLVQALGHLTKTRFVFLSPPLPLLFLCVGARETEREGYCVISRLFVCMHPCARVCVGMRVHMHVST